MIALVQSLDEAYTLVDGFECVACSAHGETFVNRGTRQLALIAYAEHAEDRHLVFVGAMPE